MTVENDPFFEGRNQTAVRTSRGSYELPILYRSGSLLGLLYRVDPLIAQEILGNLPFKPLVILGGAIALLGFFEYRETTIGKYNEVGLAILVRRSGSSISPFQLIWNLRGQQSTGLFIVHLPVNSESAWESGVELWGFPKYVTGIETSFQAHKVEATLENEVDLKYLTAPGLQLAGFPFITFSVNGRRLLRTVTDVNYRMRYCSGSNVKLSIIGSGPTADTIKRLEMINRPPSLVFYTNGLRAVLPLGRECGRLEEG